MIQLYLKKLLEKKLWVEIIPLFDKYEDLSKGSHDFKIKELIKFDENNYLNGEDDIKTNSGIFLCYVIENYRTKYSHFLIKLFAFKRLLKDFNNNSFKWLKVMVDYITSEKIILLMKCWVRFYWISKFI